MPAVHLPTYDPLCVLDGDFPVGHRNGHHEHHHQYSQHSEDQYVEDVDSSCLQVPADHSQPVGQSGNDPSKDDQRNPVPDPFGRNLFPNPHQQQRACGKGDDNHGKGEEVRIVDCCPQAICHPDCLNGAQAHRCVAVDFIDFFCSFRSLFGPFFQSRDHHCQQLRND